MKNITEYNNQEFLSQASKALIDDGFVTDEHSFAPYSDTIIKNVKDIERLLNARCNHFILKSSQTTIGRADTVFFIYDEKKIDANRAEHLVKKWIEEGFE